MSIIIKGIDKPLFCNECPCWNEEYTRCQVKDSWGKGYVYHEPPEWCPIEVVSTRMREVIQKKTDGE